MIAALSLLLASRPLEITWDAPNSCAAATELRRELDALLEASSPGPQGSARAQVSIEVHGDLYSAKFRIELADRRIERQITGTSCEVVTRAVALAIAVQVDALAVTFSPRVAPVLARQSTAHASAPARPTDTASARLGGQPASEAVGPSELDEPASNAVHPATPDNSLPEFGHPSPARSANRGDRRTPRPVTLGLRFGAGVLAWSVPRPTAVINLGLTLTRGHWRGELAGVYGFASAARLPAPDAQAGADLSLGAAMLRAAFVPPWRRFEFPLALGFEVGDMVARGVGVNEPRTHHSLWVAAVAGPGLVFAPTPRFALWLDPSLVVGLVRPRFGVDDGRADRPLFQPGILGFRAGLGLELRFL